MTNDRPDKADMKQIISDDIDTKLYVFTITDQLSFSEPKLLRTQIKKIIEKTVESWGLESTNICITGPNDDKNIQVNYSLVMPEDGKNTITGEKILFPNS